MSFLAALIHVLLAIGLGACFLRERSRHPGYALLSAGIVGVSVVAFTFLALSHAALLGARGVTLSLSLLVVFGLLGWRSLLRAQYDALVAPRSWSLLDGWDRLALVLCGLCLALYFVDSLAPPRGADAMRYHLAQLEDMARHQAYVYRPYYHYNFPLFFSYFAFPVYYVAGGVGVKLVNFLLFCALLPAVYALGRLAGLKRPLFVVLALILTPGMLYAGTRVLTDVTVTLSCLSGVLLLHRYQREPRASHLVIAYMAFGFSLGVKYQSVIFAGWVLWLTWVALGRKISWRTLSIVAGLGMIVLLMPSAFFVRNTLNTGAPTWPLYQDLFGVEKDYLYEVSSFYTNGMAGRHDIASTLKGVKALLTSPHMLPGMWLLLPLGLWVAGRRGRAREDGLYLAFGAISILCLWWFAQPKLYPRFVNFFLPALLVLAAMGAESLRGRWPRRAVALIVAVCAFYGLGITAAYSWDSLRYQVDRDEQAYHRFTWFWNEYRWIDDNLPPDARLLVIVMSGHTYYLDRDYVRADPFLTGTIDWRNVDAADLRKELASRGIRYILYENRDWSIFPGGERMQQLLERLSQEDGVEVLWRRDVQLVLSRLRRSFQKSEVWLLEVDS